MDVGVGCKVVEKSVSDVCKIEDRVVGATRGRDGSPGSALGDRAVLLAVIVHTLVHDAVN